MTYTPHTPDEVRAMLKKIGVRKVDDLYSDIPGVLRLEKLDLPRGMNAADAEHAVAALADKNTVFASCFRGAGAYRHYIPATCRTVAELSSFVTAYTPYQAELSQGILQSIFEYQTMVCMLTGMEVSNASHYDGATAAAEGVLMWRGDPKRTKVLVASQIKPGVRTVLGTYLSGVPFEIVTAPEADGVVDVAAATKILDNTFLAVYVEQPNFSGRLEDLAALAAAAHRFGAKLVVGCYPISLGLLKNPASQGADVAVGEGQPLGLPTAFGGPYLGFMATTKANMRKLPGRIVGETKDAKGERAFVLTLQAREQHIRREHASSNICSNEAHCALIATVYLATQGPAGLRAVAEACVSNAHYLAAKLEAAGFKRVHAGEFFNEFVTESAASADEILAKLAKKGILGGLKVAPNRILWCATELNTKKEMDRLARLIKQ